jgi:hypothetical protein
MEYIKKIMVDTCRCNSLFFYTEGEKKNTFGLIVSERAGLSPGFTYIIYTGSEKMFSPTWRKIYIV